MRSESDKNPLVCVFDSGIGGINLLYECTLCAPQCDFAYFADNYNVPYGNLDGNSLFVRADAVFEKIAAMNPAAAVVACNTVTALCIDRLRQKYPFKIVGIQPAVKPAAAEGECLVLATAATANSRSLANLVALYGRGRTRVVACPDLASYVEENVFSLSESVVNSMLPDAFAETVALGCTHYSFVRGVVKERYRCRVWDGTTGTARRLSEILGICNHQSQKRGKVDFLSGNAQKNAEIFEILKKYGRDWFLRK